MGLNTQFPSAQHTLYVTPSPAPPPSYYTGFNPHSYAVFTRSKFHHSSQAKRPFSQTKLLVSYTHNLCRSGLKNKHLYCSLFSLPIFSLKIPLLWITCWPLPWNSSTVQAFGPKCHSSQTVRAQKQAPVLPNFLNFFKTACNLSYSPPFPTAAPSPPTPQKIETWLHETPPPPQHFKKRNHNPLP